MKISQWSLATVVGLCAIGLIHAQATAPAVQKEAIRGHVVADVASLAFGSGLGPKWTRFIFSVEDPDGPKLVLIEYAFYQTRQLPSDAFWNYENTYAMRVKRDTTCDATVGEISYERNVDTNGKELQPSFVLRFTESSPVHTLDPALKLPCYVLWYDDYEQVKTESAG